MARLITNCGGLGYNCPGSPESMELRKKEFDGNLPKLGGAICRDKCHTDIFAPCTGTNPETGEKYGFLNRTIPLPFIRKDNTLEAIMEAMREHQLTRECFPSPSRTVPPGRRVKYRAVAGVKGGV